MAKDRLQHIRELSAQARELPEMRIDFPDDECDTLTDIPTPSRAPMAVRAHIGAMLALEPKDRPRATREVLLVLGGLALGALVVAGALFAYLLHLGNVPSWLR